MAGETLTYADICGHGSRDLSEGGEIGGNAIEAACQGSPFEVAAGRGTEHGTLPTLAMGAPKDRVRLVTLLLATAKRRP